MTPLSRQDIFQSLRDKPDISVLIVGAGINGSGTFRELALQGIDVLLIDRADIAAGASAASTRMAHGGLRYLETGQFRLVRESLHERNRLLINAPHAVEPLPITIPIFSWLSGLVAAPLKFFNLLSKPSPRGAVLVKIGLLFYDFFTRNQRVMPPHHILSRQQALQQHPGLDPRIVCAASYFDALMPQAERLCVEVVLDGEAAYDRARALNYVSLIHAAGDTVQLRDELSGETVTVKPQVMINASGAWIDRVNGAIQRPTRYIGGTKGSHLIVDNPVLNKALNGESVYFENPDGRLCIILPFRDKAIIGSTDIRIDDPDKAICDDQEIDYMLDFTRRIFPGLPIIRSDIVFHFSGVRPLPNSDLAFVGNITRDHTIHVDEPDANLRFPVYSLVGGKWTTFRALSEQTADMVLARLQKPRLVRTELLPIGGGKDYPRSKPERQRWINRMHQSTKLPPARLQELLERYGTRAEAIATYIVAEPDETIRENPTYTQREIMFIAQHEKVGHLDDVILRRSLLAILGWLDGNVLTKVGEAAGSALGWSLEQTHAEIERAARILMEQHGVPAERLQVAIKSQ